MKRISILLLVPLIIMLGGCSLFRKKKNDTEQAKRPLITEPVNQIPVSERPYLSLSPVENGRQIMLYLNKINKPADEAEFELEYNAGDLLRGAFGSIDLVDGTGSYEVLLGSCSTGGTCSYDSDISGGTATVILRGSENYAVKVNWRYQETSVADGKFGSQDQKIQLTGESLFAKSNYVIISEASGLPEALEGEILAGPYSVAPSNGISASDTGTVTLRLAQESETAQIWAWNESEWISLETTIEGKSVSSSGEIYPLYVVTN